MTCRHSWVKWRPHDAESKLMRCSKCEEFTVSTAADWLSTPAACKQLGITNRTLYSIIDRGELTAYKFGRVIRLKQTDVTQFLEHARIRPGELDHLYPEKTG